MSHYKPYPAYKDSGVEWIGRVPEHWQIAPVKAISTILNGATPESAKTEYWDGDIAWYTPTDIDNEIVKELGAPRRYISQEGFDSCAVKLAPPGSVVLSTRAPIGSVGITSVPSTTNQGCRTLVPTESLSGKFLASVLVAARDELRLRGNGTTFQELSADSLRSLRVPLPPPNERKWITDHLDRETARIDALIAKKTRFIELLKEKRQALITHAVTKGLDPNVKMKDSGVEWIGEVPEHWDFVPSNSLFTESKERAWAEDEHLSATQKYGVIPLTEYERLEKRQVTHAVKNLDQRKHAEVDDFVISMRSFEGGIERVKARGCVRSSYVVLKANEHVHVGFFTYLFKSGAYIQGLQATATFIRDGQDISYNNFRQVKLLRPSHAEQKSIADFLDKSVSRIDRLTEKTQRSIDLLKERRSAFITAAVTGQIDLREEA